VEAALPGVVDRKRLRGLVDDGALLVEVLPARSKSSSLMTPTGSFPSTTITWWMPCWRSRTASDLVDASTEQVTTPRCMTWTTVGSESLATAGWVGLYWATATSVPPLGFLPVRSSFAPLRWSPDRGLV